MAESAVGAEANVKKVGRGERRRRGREAELQRLLEHCERSSVATSKSLRPRNRKREQAIARRVVQAVARCEAEDAAARRRVAEAGVAQAVEEAAQRQAAERARLEAPSAKGDAAASVRSLEVEVATLTLTLTLTLILTLTLTLTLTLALALTLA